MPIKRFFILLILLTIILPLSSSAYLPARQGEGEMEGARRLVFNNKSLEVYQDSSLIWQSEPDYKIADFLLADLDSDNSQELIVLLYKRGYYGPHLPFWEDKNIDDYGQHLFVYELDPEVKLKWGSSTIGYKIKNLDFQGQRLIVNQEEEWIWQEFGFERIN